MSYKIRKTTRLTIYRELLNTNTAISFSVDSKRYRVPIDEFAMYLKDNTDVFHTASWLNRGIYHWPRPTKKLFLFLEQYDVSDQPEDDKQEKTHWEEMLEKLMKYKKERGHCYVPADYNQTNYGVQDPLVTWVLKTRRDYVDNNLDQNKIRALDNINFLKWTSLKQYFDPENIKERNTLINALQNIRTDAEEQS